MFHLRGLILCCSLVFDPPCSGLIVGSNWRWARPKANAWARVGAKPAHHIVQLGGSEVSERLLIQIEFIQFFHKQRTSSRLELYKMRGGAAPWPLKNSVCGTEAKILLRFSL